MWHGFYAIIHVNVNMIRARVPPDMAYTIKIYDKCSKILNTFLFLLSTKLLVFSDGIDKTLVRIANREDPDQTASSEAV